MIDQRLQVFVSSKMRRNVLKAERQAARDAIKGLGIFEVWDWETCSHADCKPPIELCLEAVRNSSALVLILGRDLTPHTKKEHREAVKYKIPDFIFIKGNPKCLNSAARDYVDKQKKRSTYQNFSSLTELKTSIRVSLRNHILETYKAGWQFAIGTQLPKVEYPQREARCRGKSGAGGKR